MKRRCVGLSVYLGLVACVPPHGEPASPLAEPLQISAAPVRPPTAPPPKPSPPIPSGRPLSAESIRVTIELYEATTKYACWDAPAVQNVAEVDASVFVVVGKNGEVTSADASGNHPWVVRCLESELRGWRFDGPGKTEIPFHFVRR